MDTTTEAPIWQSIRSLHIIVKARLYLLVLAAAISIIAWPAATAQVVTDHGGPIMQAPRVYPIFWLPPGFHFDASNQASADALYESLITRFFSEISAGDYLNILSQYPGICSPPAIPTDQSCFGTVTVASPVVDTHPYPHAGTNTDPLHDLDITDEVRQFISDHNLSPGLDQEFFVFLGGGVVECIGSGNALLVGNPCAGSAFCAYHSAIPMAGTVAVYAVMPDTETIGGCHYIDTSPNQLLAADQEILAISHELAESMAGPDPGHPAWESTLTGIDEIGDYCAYMPIAGLRADGSNISLGPHPYVVQQLWSDDDDACVLGLSRPITTGTVEISISTASSGVLQQSASIHATPHGWAQFPVAALTLHSPGQPAWTESSPHVRTNAWPAPFTGSVLGSIGIGFQIAVDPSTHWDVTSIELKFRNPNGTLFCDQATTFSPPAGVNGAGDVEFQTPNCRGTGEPIECYVVDDGYTNIEGPSDAVFISGRTTNNEQGKACIPGGQFGQCRKWLGKCATVTTDRPVSFQVFDDGYANPTANSGAVYIPKDGNQACISNGTPTGDCRRWFGRGTTDDGRTVDCIVFDDGYANPSSDRSDAIYIPKPIPGPGAACIPGDPAATGVCRRWFGRCLAH